MNGYGAGLYDEQQCAQALVGEPCAIPALWPAIRRVRCQWQKPVANRCAVSIDI